MFSSSVHLFNVKHFTLTFFSILNRISQGEAFVKRLEWNDSAVLKIFINSSKKKRKKQFIFRQDNSITYRKEQRFQYK